MEREPFADITNKALNDPAFNLQGVDLLRLGVNGGPSSETGNESGSLSETGNESGPSSETGNEPGMDYDYEYDSDAVGALSKKRKFCEMVSEESLAPGPIEEDPEDSITGKIIEMFRNFDISNFFNSD
jgi:hypothetical protein